tara:strand:+ start:338 stop:1456 length:1119 start_codon:yes stop_codon:yes gene_type:complete
MYCKTCLFPNTKPDIHFNNQGICDSCLSAKRKHGKKKSINWEKREKDFQKILERSKKNSGSYYDCIVPVSGGKDSTWQVYVMKKKHKMNPLAITFDQFDQTSHGKKNLDILRQIGVDHVHFTMNPLLIKKLVKTGFEIIGDPYWVNHVGILTVPIHFACKFKIPLVVYGENPIFEYGGPEADRDNYIMNKKWRQQHGGMRGMREEDVVSHDIKIEDIKILTFPTDKEVLKNKVQAIFYGHFFKWEPEKHTKFIQTFGWKPLKKAQEGSWSITENIDMEFIDIRERIKFLKYGYGRATDQLNIAIRSNLISRNKALKIAKKIDGKVNKKNITSFCKYLNISKSEYDVIVDSFVNHDLFIKDNENGWRLKKTRI